MTASLIVLKFGGTSLFSSRRIRRAAGRLLAWRRAGHRVLAVVSATGHTTDRIVRRLTALGADPVATPGAETDRALVTGELLSAALVAAAVESLGTPARSLSGAEAGLLARGSWGHGVLESLDPEPLEEILAGGAVPVVAGFQAGTASGGLITLGRGSSDLSAVFLATRLGARACHIVTDVPGVFERDPRIDPKARRLERLTPAELVSLTRSGAEVVHPEAARLAAEADIPLRVYQWDADLRGRPGTLIASDAGAVGVSR
jgi:aspartate kinase